MRISDWSSDVCSSDLAVRIAIAVVARVAVGAVDAVLDAGRAVVVVAAATAILVTGGAARQQGEGGQRGKDELAVHEAVSRSTLASIGAGPIGSPPCRASVCQFV